MHRTDIEGFGHHEDRIQMEHFAGALGGVPSQFQQQYGAAPNELVSQN
jgi:hypothetical protein